MALTHDVKLVRYGTPDGHQPINKGLAANVTVYRGSIAVLSGAGGTQGYLKNGATPISTDQVVGMIEDAGPGIPNINPGITGGAANGDIKVNIYTGSAVLACGTGSDALDVTTNFTNVYLINEVTVGKTDGGATRPVAGLQVSCNTDDPSIPVGFVAVKMGTKAGPFGGP